MLFSALEQPEINRIAINENRAIIMENRKLIERVEERVMAKLGQRLETVKEEKVDDDKGYLTAFDVDAEKRKRASKRKKKGKFRDSLSEEFGSIQPIKVEGIVNNESLKDDISVDKLVQSTVKKDMDFDTLEPSKTQR